MRAGRHLLLMALLSLAAVAGLLAPGVAHEDPRVPTQDSSTLDTVIPGDPEDLARGLTVGALRRLATARNPSLPLAKPPADLDDLDYGVPAEASRWNLDEDPDEEAAIYVQGDIQTLLVLDLREGVWTILDAWQPEDGWYYHLDPDFPRILGPDRHALVVTRGLSHGTGVYNAQRVVLALERGRLKEVLAIWTQGHVVGWGTLYDREWSATYEEGPADVWPRDILIEQDWTFDRADELAQEYPDRYPDLASSPRAFKLDRVFRFRWTSATGRYRDVEDRYEATCAALWNAADPREESVPDLVAVE